MQPNSSLPQEANMDRRTGILARAFAITAISLGLMLLLQGRACAGQCETKGACYVTEAGSGATNGVDWNNAYAGLPVSLSCGVAYYLAGGSYDYTSTSTTISNACGAGSPLVIYKAVSGGPGNPQNVAGWQSSYGTSQALFTQATDADPQKQYNNPFFTLSGTYITIDGVVPASGTPTKTATFGIHLQSSNNLVYGFVYVTGANNTVKHVELDGIANTYGFQVTACNRTSSGQVTVTTNGNPPWVVGDNVDLYMNGGTPTDFTTVPPSHGWPITSISGNQLQYTQTGNTNAESCSVVAASTIVLNFSPLDGVIISVAANPSYFSLTDNYIHDISNPVHFLASGGCPSGCSFLRNYFARNHSMATEHSNGIAGAVFNNSVIGQSVFEDIEGTSITAPICGGSCNWQNDAIYSNLVFCTVASQSQLGDPSTSAWWKAPQCGTSGIFSDDNGANQATNLLIYGNTIVRPINCKITVSNASSTAVVVNNFMYCPAVAPGNGSVQINGTGVSHSYNTGWGGTLSSAPTPGTGDYFTTTFPAATSVFFDPSDTGENFHIASETVDVGTTGCTSGTNCLNDGTALSAPYNLDLVGAPRVSGQWTRGAYQWVPMPPTAVSVTGAY